MLLECDPDFRLVIVAAFLEGANAAITDLCRPPVRLPAKTPTMPAELTEGEKQAVREAKALRQASLKPAGISVRELMQKEWRTFPKAELAEACLEKLAVERKLMRQHSQSPHGGHPVWRYSVPQPPAEELQASCTSAPLPV